MKVIEHVNKDNKEIIPCLTEKDLLSKFLDLWVTLDPTIVVGYNSDFFDIPYLYIGWVFYQLSGLGGSYLSIVELQHF